MAYEDYNLVSIRTRLREEFSLSNTAEINTIIDKRINDAVAWIVSRRKNWPWMHRIYALTVSGSVDGIFQMPDGFIRITSVHKRSDGYAARYRNPVLFEHVKASIALVSSVNMVYTVIPDPNGAVSNLYVKIYPYSGIVDTLDITYYSDARKLVDDANVPDVPRSDRFAVWCAAVWFVAQWQKDADMVQMYRELANSELEKMTSEYQFADDITEESEDVGEVDFSTLKGPAGFPEFPG